MNVFSTYHFDIPFILNVDRGVWASKAFKGEIFVYSWEHLDNSYQLLAENKFEQLCLNSQKNTIQYYTHVMDDIFVNFEQTSELIKINSTIIFKYLFDHKTRKELYYYRPLELEFKQTAK